jgi:hypothetical protein
LIANQMEVPGRELAAQHDEDAEETPCQRS